MTLFYCFEEVEKIAKIKDEIKNLQLLFRYKLAEPSAEYSLYRRFGLKDDEIDKVPNLINKHGLNFVWVYLDIDVGSNDPNLSQWNKNSKRNIW